VFFIFNSVRNSLRFFNLHARLNCQTISVYKVNVNNLLSLRHCAGASDFIAAYNIRF